MPTYVCPGNHNSGWHNTTAVVLAVPVLVGSLPLLGLTRLLEGASTAASVPSVLGYVAVVTSGDEALEVLAGQSFDVVVLDIKMPGMDGIDMLRRINEERAEEIIATGAKTLAVACPFCTTMLRDGILEKESEVQVKDIVEIIDEAIS